MIKTAQRARSMESSAISDASLGLAPLAMMRQRPWGLQAGRALSASRVRLGTGLAAKKCYIRNALGIRSRAVQEKLHTANDKRMAKAGFIGASQSVADGPGVVVRRAGRRRVRMRARRGAACGFGGRGSWLGGRQRDPGCGCVGPSGIAAALR